MIFGFLGTTEVVVILVIALLVFGPQKLPEVGKQIGSAYRELNRVRNEVTRALDLDDHSHNNHNRYDTYDYNQHQANDTNALPAYDVLGTPEVSGGAIAPYNHATGARTYSYDDTAFVAPPGPQAHQPTTPSAAMPYSPDQAVQNSAREESA